VNGGDHAGEGAVEAFHPAGDAGAVRLADAGGVEPARQPVAGVHAGAERGEDVPEPVDDVERRKDVHAAQVVLLDHRVPPGAVQLHMRRSAATGLARWSSTIRANTRSKLASVSASGSSCSMSA
jgi:hypothetical protein